MRPLKRQIDKGTRRASDLSSTCCLVVEAKATEIRGTQTLCEAVAAVEAQMAYMLRAQEGLEAYPHRRLKLYAGEIGSGNGSPLEAREAPNSRG